MLAPVDTSARWAAAIFRAVVPKAFENLIRTRAPPMVGLTTIRTVWFSNVGDGGSPGNGNGACIAVLHALIQCPRLLAGSAQAAGMTIARVQIRTTACFAFAIS